MNLSGRRFIKKSGWRKMAMYFNISLEIQDLKEERDPNGLVSRASCRVRGTMPCGRFADAYGSCDRGEKRFQKPNSDIPATAETRAKTRAIQDLLGIGESKDD